MAPLIAFVLILTKPFRIVTLFLHHIWKFVRVTYRHIANAVGNGAGKLLKGLAGGVVRVIDDKGRAIICIRENVFVQGDVR